MTTSTISQIFAWEALDSRGKPTVACSVELASGATGRTVVPSGASTGGHEAVELRDGGGRYGGAGVSRAVAHVNGAIRDLLIGMDGSEQETIDLALESLDPDPALSTLGANAVLAASLSTLQAAAAHRSLPLWSHLSGERPLLPMPMVNIFSGGAHAQGLLDIQDVLVIPIDASTFAQAMEWVSRIRTATVGLMADRGLSGALVADEGGLAAALGSNREALMLVTDAIAAAGLRPGEDAVLAVDLAANQFWDGTSYQLRSESATLTRGEWLAVVANWCREFPIASVEDVVFEDDWAGWVTASETHGSVRQLLGDDLFATNIARLERGIDQHVANAVLVKPNQAGTVSRARAVVLRAHEHGYGTVVSARSGDTEDFWLADLAVGWQSGQIKVGSTMRSERTAKWNRLMEIEARAGASARFAGRDAIARWSS
jgi:enolase